MYRSKDYNERPLESIFEEIEIAAKIYPQTERIFLADGDAINLPTNKMVEILRALRAKFPEVKRISCYAMPSNLLRKTDEELKALKEEGLSMLYIGVESGNDVILKKVTKGATGRSIIKACKKAHRQGFVISCMVILGLGGKKYSHEHISDTASVLSEASPEFVGALNLHLDDELKGEFLEKFGEPFLPLEDIEVLDEVERLVAGLSTSTPVVFRANHASNVYSFGGTLPTETESVLASIRKVKSAPQLWKPKVLRGF